MADTRIRRTPGPDHPITIEPSPSRVVVRRGPVIVAETTHAIELREAGYAPVFYIPIGDVDGRLLRDSDHHTYCPYKGEASYYDLVDADGTVLDAAIWYYSDPYPEVGAIKDRVAFYRDRVTITVDGD